MKKIRMNHWKGMQALLLAGALLAGTFSGCGMPKGSNDLSGDVYGGEPETELSLEGDSGSGSDSEGEGAADLAEPGQLEEASEDMAFEAGEAEVNASGLAAEEPVEFQVDGEPRTEEYAADTENRFLQVSLNPLSTFSADVDTASYSNIRRMLQQGWTPDEIPKGAVRLEEMLNYFHYNYQQPAENERFGITVDGTKCPWEPDHGLIRIGISTQEIDFSKSPKSNLVFLLDVSGSMDEPNKLPLLKQAFSMLVENLDEKDRVSIVTYAGVDEIVLDGARGNEKSKIQRALDQLEAEGSTNGSAGIQTAYELAREHFIVGGNNRVILATDGDLNVGQTSESELQSLIGQERKSGIYLSVLGFGEGNLKDNKLETLADQGNGNYAYIDSRMEARRVLVEEMGSTLLTVAEDVKLQVEFNPAQISEYRLIGYENRLLEAEDFMDDTKDAGEVGAGHSVTALYEVVWADGEGEGPDLKYQQREPVDGEARKEWATLKIRYKEPQASESKELVRAFGQEIYAEPLKDANMLLAASVAEFGMLLKDSAYRGNSSYGHILELWENVSYSGNEEVAEFLELVRLAKGDMTQAAEPEEISKEEPGEGQETVERPPTVQLLTTDQKGEVSTCTYATLGSYEWSAVNPDGTAESVIACGSGPKDWEEIARIELEETNGEILLGISRNMVEYSVCYWEEGSTCGVADPVPMEGDRILLTDGQAKGTYQIHVTYLEGEADYGFKVE